MDDHAVRHLDYKSTTLQGYPLQMTQFLHQTPTSSSLRTEEEENTHTHTKQYYLSRFSKEGNREFGIKKLGVIITQLITNIHLKLECSTIQ